jgi:hypothetical protein
MIFYEHVDREYEIAQILEERLSKLSKKRGLILSIIYQRHLLLFYKPKLIIFPSSAWTEINYIYYLYSEKIDIVSLNYEQMLSAFNERAKAPQGDILKNKLLHFAWTEKYSEYLYKNEVCIHNIKIVDKYVYQLIREKSNLPNIKNNSIKSKYKNIVFVPLTDLQAFKNDERIKKEFNSGRLFEDALKRRNFVLESVKIILKWIYNFASTEPSVCFIIRPHPSVGIENYYSLRESMELPDLQNIVYNYEGSAIDFFQISDILITNYSSLILDADFCGLRGLILEPVPFPKNLTYEWFNSFSRVHSYNDFNLELKKNLNDSKKLLSSKRLEKSNGIDDAANKIYLWSTSMNQPYEKLSRINLLLLFNYKLIKFFMASFVRLALLRHFKISLKESFLRDGIKIEKM